LGFVTVCWLAHHINDKKISLLLVSHMEVMPSARTIIDALSRGGHEGSDLAFYKLPRRCNNDNEGCVSQRDKALTAVRVPL
jgi:hypothetical protein